MGATTPVRSTITSRTPRRRRDGVRPAVLIHPDDPHPVQTSRAHTGHIQLSGVPHLSPSLGSLAERSENRPAFCRAAAQVLRHSPRTICAMPRTSKTGRRHKGRGTVPDTGVLPLGQPHPSGMPGLRAHARAGLASGSRCRARTGPLPARPGHRGVIAHPYHAVPDVAESAARSAPRPDPQPAAATRCSPRPTRINHQLVKIT
jgi:hypothetical protein